jgi:hypothetical protein
MRASGLSKLNVTLELATPRRRNRPRKVAVVDDVLEVH